MVYNVDVKRIEKQFHCLKDGIHVLHQLRDRPLDHLENAFALARALHIAIEAMIDVGSLLIDGFIMRDPGGYLDIVEILEDEAVLSPALSIEIKKLVLLREKLVRDYDELKFEEMTPFIQRTDLLVSFMESVKAYLEKELT